DRRAVLDVDLGHAHLASQNAVHRFIPRFETSRQYLSCTVLLVRLGRLYFLKALISTSTPAGSSSFISASTVWLVGSKMSSSRLWVRISNCSRDFLSTCGERFTVNRSMRVGSGIGPRTWAPVRFAVTTISFVD